MSDSDSLASGPACREVLQQAAAALLHVLAGHAAGAGIPDRPAAGLEDAICPPEGRDLDAVLAQLAGLAAAPGAGRWVLSAGCEAAGPPALSTQHSAPSTPHPPLLFPALVGALVVGVLGALAVLQHPAPGTQHLEEALVAGLCREAGLPATADGCFTGGSAESAALALRLARDLALHTRLQWSAPRWGLPPEAAALRLLCAEGRHTRVERAAAQLGLGADAVVRVAVDDDGGLGPAALTAALQRLRAQELEPAAIVASAGAWGAAGDPLPAIAPIARAWGSWLHVEVPCAAWLFSERQRPRLRGLAEADSLGLDFCPPRLGGSLALPGLPGPCSAFLVRDAATVDRLDPGGGWLSGLRETAPPRAEALQLWICLQLLGRRELAALVDAAMDRLEGPAGNDGGGSA